MRLYVDGVDVEPLDELRREQAGSTAEIKQREAFVGTRYLESAGRQFASPSASMGRAVS